MRSLWKTQVDGGMHRNKIIAHLAVRVRWSWKKKMASEVFLRFENDNEDLTLQGKFQQRAVSLRILASSNRRNMRQVCG